MPYVDGFVIPVPKRNLDKYYRLARKAGRVWMEHGALEYIECVGDDLNIKGVLTFPRAFDVKPGETVILSWIVYKSRAHRDKVNAAVIKDSRFAPMLNMKAMPFDHKRTVMGGFKTIVNE
jgi:uncharacterized protein YbaA (DUF1428 family)